MSALHGKSAAAEQLPSSEGPRPPAPLIPVIPSPFCSLVLPAWPLRAFVYNLAVEESQSKPFLIYRPEQGTSRKCFTNMISYTLMIDLQSYKRINLVVLSHYVYGDLLQQQQEIHMVPSSSSCSSLSWWTLIEFTDVIFVKMNKWMVLLLPLSYRWRNWGSGRLHNGRFCFCFCFFGCKQQKETLASRKGEWPQVVWNMEEIRSGQHGSRWTCVFPSDTLPSATPSLWTSCLSFMKYLLRSILLCARP